MQSWILDFRYNPVIKNITNHLAGMLPLLLRKTANCSACISPTFAVLYSNPKSRPNGKTQWIKYISQTFKPYRQYWIRKEQDGLNRHHLHCQFNFCYALPVQQKRVICQWVKLHGWEYSKYKEIIKHKMNVEEYFF